MSKVSSTKSVLLWLAGGVALVTGALLTWVLLTWDRIYDDVPNPQLAATRDPDVIVVGAAAGADD